MKLVLGMMVGLSPGEFVLDGDPYYILRRVIWTVTMKSLITFLTYMLCPIKNDTGEF